MSRTTVRHNHTVIHKALADAVKTDLISRNPADLADAPKRKKIHPDDLPTWSRNQLEDFLRSAVGSRWEALWILTAETGARRGEMLGLRWEDVDLDAEPSRISIRRAQVILNGKIAYAEPKTAAGRRVVGLAPRSADHLRRLRDRQGALRTASDGQWNTAGLVFCRADGNAIRGNSIHRAWSVAVKASGVPYIPFHGLRHTHITLLHQAGEPLRNISLRVGPEDPTFTLARYAHADETAAMGMGQRFQDYVGVHPSDRDA